jgi:hypothetical protein
MTRAVDFESIEVLPPGDIFMQETTATASKASQSKGVFSDFIGCVESMDDNVPIKQKWLNSYR